MSETSNSLPSRFKINEEVRFQPDLNNEATAVAAKVVGVSFSDHKVYYDVAIKPTVNDDYYEVNPLMHVDSVFVIPLIKTPN